MSRFAELLQDRRVIVADGATGTSYQERGLEIGEAPEEWLFKSPERVIELHRAFVEAGADLLLTDTFGATPLRLQHTSLAGRVHDVNVRAVELAREAAGNHLLVAGSMGPTGHLFEPLGPLTSPSASRTTPSRQVPSPPATPTSSCWRRSSRSTRRWPRSRARGGRATYRWSSRSASTRERTR